VTRLPPEFAEVEPFAATWCLGSESERYARRLASSMDEMQDFYDAFFPRLNEAIDYCDRFALDDLPAEARRLLELVYSLVMVAMPVEIWRQPRPVDSAAATLERVVEPLP
jgi:hypothetical protein